MSLMEQEYLKQLYEANQKIQALKKERLSLLRKLKGVRAAKVRDLAKADERLRNCINTSSSVIQSLLDKKAETRADRLDFILWHLSNNLVESGKLTQNEWEGAYLAALNEYTRMHRKGESK